MSRRRRGNGAGSIERHRARWRVRVTIEGRRRTLTTCETRREAQAILDAFLAERAAERILSSDALTLADLGQRWLDRREVEGSPTRTRVKSIETERSVWRRQVEPSPLAHLAIESIRIRDVEAYTRWLRRHEAVRARWSKAGTTLEPTGRPISTTRGSNP